MCRFLGAALKGVVMFPSFPSSAGWNVDKMAGVWAAIMHYTVRSIEDVIAGA